jgi:hypothetical protein
MIDWRTAKIASSGIRGIRLRLRHMMISPSRAAEPSVPAAAAGRVVEVAVMPLPPP